MAAATVLVEPFSRLALAAGRRSFSEIVQTVRGYWMLWKSLPTIFRAGIEGIVSARRSPEGVRPGVR